jgi:hypothetical protein
MICMKTFYMAYQYILPQKDDIILDLGYASGYFVNDNSSGKVKIIASQISAISLYTAYLPNE